LGKKETSEFRKKERPEDSGEQKEGESSSIEKSERGGDGVSFLLGRGQGQGGEKGHQGGKKTVLLPAKGRFSIRKKGEHHQHSGEERKFMKGKGGRTAREGNVDLLSH